MIRQVQDVQAILSFAQGLLREGGPENSAVESPIEVRSPEGMLHSWFVPVTSDGTIAGFYEFLPDGKFLRFSLYRGDQAYSDWLSPEKLVHCSRDERCGKPFLSYDGSPARIVWAVPLIRGEKETLVYVAGKTVYPVPVDARPQ
ncbi:MAG: hypothetical protein HKL98_02480 [Burkholderiales bacterium]|nr:hypothetical protein [Burkholderiales bacterium]